jgi:anti-sigma B factor antagonist
MPKMYRATKFVCPGMFRFATNLTKIYEFFMMPKPPHARLSINMQTMNPECQSWPQPLGVAAFQLHKEPKLKLSLETRNRGDVMIVHCHGRIVYRDEVAALSRLVAEVLEHSRKLVLDLSGVNSMDSAGLGELALLHTWAHDKNAVLKCAGPNSFVRSLLDLTNLDSVLDVHFSVEGAVESFQEDKVCADC